MEFGCGFDDDLFEDEKEKKKAAPISYNAKFCEPLWFMAAEGENEEEFTQIMKQRADWAFRKGDHRMALEAYQTCLGLIAANAISLRRDMVESVIRCHLALGQLTEALQLAEKTHHEAGNFEQKSNTLQVLLKVHQRMASWQGALGCLQRCIILHPQNSNYWTQLADIYANILVGEVSHCGSSSEAKNVSQMEHCKEFHGGSVINAGASDITTNCIETAPSGEECSVKSSVVSTGLKREDGERSIPNGHISNVSATTHSSGTCDQSSDSSSLSEKMLKMHVESGALSPCMPVATCLLTARLLLKISRFGLTQFGKDRNDRLMNQLSEKLKQYSVSEEDVDRCTAFMQKDLFGEEDDASSTKEDTLKYMEEVIDEDDDTVNQYFIKRWMSWR